MKKYKKILLINIIVIISFLIIMSAVVLIARYDLRYELTDRISGIFEHIDLSEWNGETVTVDAKQLDSLYGCVHNQALMLINKEHPLNIDFTPELTDYNRSGVMMNSSVTDGYAMLSAYIREKYDKPLYISSSYRTAEEQAEILSEKGSQTAAAVGESEHEAGLALDVYVPYYAGASFLKTDAGQYVNRQCREYSFIIRYPYYGQEITGIEFEPWHIRYVGLPHAEIISRNRITLEEYIDSLEPDKFYKYCDYIILRTAQSDTYTVPAEFSSVTISQDNTGYVILTFRK